MGVCGYEMQLGRHRLAAVKGHGETFFIGNERNDVGIRA